MKLASPGEVRQPQQEKKVGRTQKQDKIIVILRYDAFFCSLFLQVLTANSGTCGVSSTAWFESV